jgi:hypothetical protein
VRLLLQPIAFCLARAGKLRLRTLGLPSRLLDESNRRVVISNGGSLSTLMLPSSYLSRVG